MRSPAGSRVWNSGARRRNRILVPALAAIFLIAAAPLRAQTRGGDESVVVHDVRLGQWPDRTRLVVETDRELAFRLASGASGEQIAVTLEGVDRSALASALERLIPTDYSMIRGYHLNGGKPSGAHLVLVFSESVRANPFNLAPDNGYGHRLVLDFFEATPRQNEPGASASLAQQPRSRPMPSNDLPDQSAAPRAQANENPDSVKLTDHRAVSKPSAPVQERMPAMTGETEEIWLEARLNHQRQPTTVLALRQAGGQLLLAESDLRRWRITVPPDGGIAHHGERFYPLAELDIKAELDLRRLTLDLQAPPALLGATRLEGSRRQQLPLTPSPFGAFFNYDLTSTRASDNEVQSGALLELGAFNGWGSGVSNFVVRNNQPETESSFVRTDTTWRRDDPEKMRTLSLGDTFTRGTNWSGAVRFGGIQWGSNFSTQPEFITMPLMAMSGEAALPSTVDLFVNDALRLRREVPPGPFTIDEIPTVTGRGQARLVVRDILGRERIITQDFYASQRLLREGLNEYSVELGSVRQNYGLESNDYGDVLASATWRTGVSDRLTTEFHGQAAPNHQMAGVGASWLMPFGGVVYSALAASQGDDGQGELLNLGLQRQGKVFSLGFDSQLTSEGFTRAGMTKEYPLPAHQSRIFGSLAQAGGSLSVGYTFQDYRERQDVEFATLSYSVGLGRFGYLSLSALHFIDNDSTTLQASLTLPLGMDRTTASFGLSHTDKRSDGKVQVQRSLPVGTGFGYRLEAEMGDSDRQTGSVSYQNDYGALQLEASRVNGQTGTRANVRGGAAYLDGGLYLSRRLDDSFAVVKVPGFADVRIYAENQEVARTNGDGKALVPRLRAYERNRLRVEQADLPLGANIGNLEMQVSPSHRSGIAVEFPVSRTRDVFFRLVLDNGDFLPVGATVMTESGEYFPVGMRGEVFLTGLKPINQLEARWRKQSCHFVIEVPESDEPLIELGEIRCSGITRE